MGCILFRLFGDFTVNWWDDSRWDEGEWLFRDNWWVWVPRGGKGEEVFAAWEGWWGGDPNHSNPTVVLFGGPGPDPAGNGVH